MCWRGHPTSEINKSGKCRVCHKLAVRMYRRGKPSRKRPLYRLDLTAMRRAMRRMTLMGIAVRAEISKNTLQEWAYKKHRPTRNLEALNRVHRVIGAREIKEMREL